MRNGGATRWLLACLGVAIAAAAPAQTSMYACTAPDGATSIQDRPCGANVQEKRYAMPGKPAPAPASRARSAKARVVDFTVACRSLDEERLAVIEAITTSGDPRQTARLQKRLKRIGQAQCTARCGSC